MVKGKEVLVSVLCIAFNQERYIAKAVEGFLMQKTSFEIEIIIHDDCSTDKTGEILRTYAEKYPHKIKLIQEEVNQYSVQGYKFLKDLYEIAEGKYIAFCEGDDYWSDENKLQKEVDFLESHNECGMVYTDFDLLHQNSGKLEKQLFRTKPSKFKNKYTLESWILSPGYVAPMTWVFEKGIMNQYDFLDTLDETFVMFAHFLHSTNVECLINEDTAVYRSLVESASHSSDLNKVYKRARNIYEIQMHLANKYCLSEKSKFQIQSGYYNKVYKLLSVLDKRDEIEEAKKYCRQNRQRLLFLITSIPIIKDALKFVYLKMR